MPQRFVYNARTGELSGITSLKLGNPQVSIEQYIVNYLQSNASAREDVYDSDLVISTMLKGLGSASFDSDQIVAIINENSGTGLNSFDSDQIVSIIEENRLTDDTGFDSDQIVSIIRENENTGFDSDQIRSMVLENQIDNTGFDSDQIVAIIDENAPVAGFDSDQIVTIINENPGPLRDSDYNTLSILRNDHESDSIKIKSTLKSINALNTRIDSDGHKLQSLQTQVDAIEAVGAKLADSDYETLNNLRNDLDSESAVIRDHEDRIQLLESNADSDQVAIAILRRDADSDSLAIQDSKTQAEYDANLIGLLRAELDSDETSIEILFDRVDALENDRDSDRIITNSLRDALDSDSIKLQQHDSDIRNLYDRVVEVELGDASSLNARLDSDEIVLQDLRTRIDQAVQTNGVQSSNINKLFSNIDSETLRIQRLIAASDSDSLAISALRASIDSESTEIRKLRSDLDSEITEIRALRKDVDSDAGASSGFDSDQIVAIINENQSSMDSDVAATAALRRDLDSETLRIQDILTRIDSDAAAITVLRIDVDSDGQAIQNNLQTQKFDIQNLTTRLDSDETAIQANNYITNIRLDSDETKIQDLSTRVGILEAGADSDRAAIAQLRRDADSDSIAIQSIREAVDSDYALFNNKIELFNGLTDSDLTTVSNLRNDLDSESAVISKLRADLDSDFINRPTGFDSDQIVSIIGENVLSTGKDILLGTEAYDSEYQSPRALVETFDSDTSVTSAIDQLNEAMHNVLNSTAVTNVSFTANNTSGGEGMSVTLTINADGNPNRYDVYWGEGETTDSDTSDSTPTHTYSDNTNTPFSVRVVARNNNGRGAGSFAESSRTDYIVVYGADPVASFAIYLQESGGSSINLGTTGVETEQTIWFENTTTNTTGQTATFEIEWGDGDSDSVSNSAAGGVDGNRISHTYTTDSGTGRHTIQLTLQTHGTANPAVIPLSTSSLIKVYDSEISAPNGLSTKTISAPSSTGTSPRAASGFTDNVSGGTTISAGDSVTRTTGTGTISSGIISTYAYNAASGTLSAKVDGSTDGSKAFSTGNDSGTYTSLVITEDIDAQAINASGSTVSFASSIYAPNKYEVFKARVSKSSLSAGSHSYQLSHDATGDTNTVHFIHDDITSTPSISSAGTLSENAAGTYRYISGIPYYNTGSPTLTLSGSSITNISGQTYSNITDPVEVESGSASEGSGDAITNQDYTYANIDGSSTFLSGGIPIADTGVSSAYSIGDLSIPITSSSVRVVDNLRIRGTNVNGSGSYSNITSHKVAVHTASQSGISEIAIAVADALGATYDDDGVRIQDFNAEGDSDTPEFNGATNYYTNSPYTESTTITATDQEAAIRIGTLQHNVVDYSSGYLPAGPDRSGLTGRQYFTFAFRRSQVSSFNLNITSSSGVGGVWIAAPGTSIDSASGISGWLNCGAQYAGSGVPGSDTGNGGNGSDGCASTGGDIIGSGSLSGSYTMTLGTVSSSNATGNVILVRIGLDSGDSITSLSVT